MSLAGSGRELAGRGVPAGCAVAVAVLLCVFVGLVGAEGASRPPVTPGPPRTMSASSVTPAAVAPGGPGGPACTWPEPLVTVLDDRTRTVRVKQEWPTEDGVATRTCRRRTGPVLTTVPVTRVRRTLLPEGLQWTLRSPSRLLLLHVGSQPTAATPLQASETTLRFGHEEDLAAVRDWAQRANRRLHAEVDPVGLSVLGRTTPLTVRVDDWFDRPPSRVTDPSVELCLDVTDPARPVCRTLRPLPAGPEGQLSLATSFTVPTRALDPGGMVLGATVTVRARLDGEVVATAYPVAPGLPVRVESSWVRHALWVAVRSWHAVTTAAFVLGLLVAWLLTGPLPAWSRRRRRRLIDLRDPVVTPAEEPVPGQRG